MGKTAIILGATGLTGSLVLNKLLEDERYTEVRVLVRCKTDINHPKLNEKIGDLLSLENYSDFLKGDEMYICIGTTKKKTPDKDLYRKIDFGIPALAADIAKQNGIERIAVVSAMGANAGSSITYNQLKGEMEQAVWKAKIPITYILRPSLIYGERRDDYRFGEKLGIVLFTWFSFLIPAKYQMTKATAIAQKMIDLCNSEEESRVVEADGI